jgi:hypothetical protein
MSLPNNRGAKNKNSVKKYYSNEKEQAPFL